MVKIKNDMSPTIVSDIFAWDGNHQNLMQQNDFLLHSIPTVFNGSVSVPYLDPKIRKSILQN